MARKICVVHDKLNEAQRGRIVRCAETYGFEVGFFSDADFDGALAYVQEDCEVIFAMSPKLLREAPATVKWYSSGSAGVDPYLKPGAYKNPDLILTSASGTFSLSISEHVLMVLLMLFREEPRYVRFAEKSEWGDRVHMRSIFGSDFVMLGAGDIGTTIAKKLKALGAMNIIGVSRSGVARDEVYDYMFKTSDLPKVLPQAHCLIMSMPSTPETEGLMSREYINMLPKDAIVINVGRGNAIDEQALADALNEGRIAGAALDVMTREPLPADDPLWTAKNMIITPHISGFFSLDVTAEITTRDFCANIEHYAKGEPMEHLVDKVRGY